MKNSKIVGVISLLLALILSSCGSTAPSSQRDKVRTLKSGCCLVKGTLILMEDETTSVIENLKVGDIVMTQMPGGEDCFGSAIKSLVKRRHEVLSEIVFETSSITLTNDHPIWVHEKGWASIEPDKSMAILDYPKVNLLKVGDAVRVKNSEGISEIIKIQEIRTINQAQDTYTITSLENGGSVFIGNGIPLAVEKLKTSATKARVN